MTEDMLEERRPVPQTVNLYVENDKNIPWLKMDAIRGLHNLYTVPMLELFDSERGLCLGRFEYFTKEEQDYKIVLRFDQRSGEEFRASVKEIVEWIAEQADDDWSMMPNPESVGRMTIAFSFASVTTAVVFKLVWF